jgi:hypothetical protein
VQNIVVLDNARVDLPAVIAIRVWLGRNGALDRAMDRAGALGELFKRKPGETAVRLRLEAPRDFSLLLDVAAKVRPDREFKAAVEAICGPECLERVAGQVTGPRVHHSEVRFRIGGSSQHPRENRPSTPWRNPGLRRLTGFRTFLRAGPRLANFR